jgi:hypothetical protein
VIIACAGEGKRWGEYLRVPKHLAQTADGEVLLHRTIEQALGMTGDVHVITPDDDRYDLPDKVPQQIIERRWRELMAIQKRINREQHSAFVGRRLEVLVEGPSPETEHLLIGRHEGQAPEIDGQVYINDGLAYPGELVTVEVTESHDYDLVGRVVERPDPRQRTLAKGAGLDVQEMTARSLYLPGRRPA